MDGKGKVERELESVERKEVRVESKLEWVERKLTKNRWTGNKNGKDGNTVGGM